MVIHGDIKGVRIPYLLPIVLHFAQENVLIDGNGDAQLADFGLALTSDGQTTTASSAFQRKGTLRFMPPEVVLNGAAKTCSADGVVLDISSV